MNTAQREKIDALFGEWDHPDGPGCAVGVYRDGEAIHQAGYGMAHLEHGVPVTPSTVFHVASLSKQFTATAVGLLARSGRISLDDELKKYLPELRAADGVTFRHAIHHTSGLRDQWDLLRLGGWRPADLKTDADILHLAARQRELNFPPGSRFQYINTGYTLMGIAVGRVTGASLREYADEHIFQPLGMRATFFHDDHRMIIKDRAQAYSPDGGGELKINVPDYETVGPTGLLSTVEDFARWERNFLSPAVGDQDFITQMLTPGLYSEGRSSGYGFGLLRGNYRGLDTVEHAGGDAGFRAHFLRFPGERLAVAVFCNLSEMRPELLARRVADVCLEGRFADGDAGEERPAVTSRAAGTLAHSAGLLENKHGLYRDSLSGTTCRIELREDRLFLVAAGGGEYELAPAGREHFRFLNVEEAECVFEPAGAGQPARMIVKYAGQETARCERAGDEELVQGWRPEEYAGRYHSDELEVQYVVECAGETLSLRRPKFRPAVLRPVSEDEFSAEGEGIQLRFEREGGGRIAGLRVSAERAWNVSFARVEG